LFPVDGEVTDDELLFFESVGNGGEELMCIADAPALCKLVEGLVDVFEGRLEQLDGFVFVEQVALEEGKVGEGVLVLGGDGFGLGFGFEELILCV
jgi:hypothetical protein